MQFILSSCLSLGLLCSAVEFQPPSSLSVAELSEHIDLFSIQTLSEPTEVTAYRILSPLQTEPVPDWGYSLEEPGKGLSEAQIQKLQSLLLDSQNYRFDVTVKALFTPEYAFRFEQSDDWVLVVIDVYSKRIEFRTAHAVTLVHYVDKEAVLPSIFKSL